MTIQTVNRARRTIQDGYHRLHPICCTCHHCPHHARSRQLSDEPHGLVASYTGLLTNGSKSGLRSCLPAAFFALVRARSGWFRVPVPRIGWPEMSLAQGRPPHFALPSYTTLRYALPPATPSPPGASSTDSNQPGAMSGEGVPGRPSCSSPPNIALSVTSRDAAFAAGSALA